MTYLLSQFFYIQMIIRFKIYSLAEYYIVKSFNWTDMSSDLILYILYIV